MKKKMLACFSNKRGSSLSDLPTWICLLNKPPSLDTKKQKRQEQHDKKRKEEIIEIKKKKEILHRHTPAQIN